MSDERLGADLSTWLHAAGSPDASYLDAVFDQTRTSRQRPAWRFPSRWIPWFPVYRPAVRLAVRLGAAAVLALVVASGALIVGSSIRDASSDSAVGSGWRLLDGQRAAQFELDARADPSGGNARGGYAFRRDDTWLLGSVTCLRVDGSVAVVGGRITSTNIGGAEGFLVWVSDGGSGGTDQVSFTLITPTDFPNPGNACPSPTELPIDDHGEQVDWRDVEGDIVVRDR